MLGQKEKKFYVKKLSKKRKANSAYINLGFKCINNCLFCAVADVSSIGMDTKDAIAAINYCLEAGCDVFTFSGGEPTIRKDFFALLNYVESAGATVILQTNARLFSDLEFCKKTLKAGVYVFYFWLHGSTKQTHDNLTRRNGSFDETVNGLKNLTSLGARVDVNFMITLKNYHDMPNFAKWIISNFEEVDTLYFTYPTPVGNAYKFAKEVLPSFSKIKETLVRTTDILHQHKKNFSIVDVPLCVIDTRRASNYISKPTVPYDLYIEPKGARWASINETGRPIYSSVCRRCNPNIREICSGVYQTYLRLYGTDGLKALNR